MKKSHTFYYLISNFYILWLAKLTSAGPIQGVQQLTEGLREIIYILIRFISEAILDINSFDEFLFAKLLLFIIVLLIVYTILKNNGILGDNKKIIWIISITISTLSIRFIPTDLVEFILFQYGALGAGLTIFFPFVIFLFFLHQSNIGPMPRKIGWIFFGLSYIAIWAFRSSDISGTAEYLYWGGILAIAIAYIFDKQIHARFGSIERQRATSAHASERYAHLQARIKELEDKSIDSSIPNDVKRNNEKTIKRWRKELREIHKEI